MDYRPIRKLLVGGLASLLALGATALGLHVGSDLVNEAAVALVGLGAAWAVKDPRVLAVVHEVEALEKVGDSAETAAGVTAPAPPAPPSK